MRYRTNGPLDRLHRTHNSASDYRTNRLYNGQVTDYRTNRLLDYGTNALGLVVRYSPLVRQSDALLSVTLIGLVRCLVKCEPQVDCVHSARFICLTSTCQERSRSESQTRCHPVNIWQCLTHVSLILNVTLFITQLCHWCFTIVGPVISNSLLDGLQDPALSLNMLRHQLKTYFFCEILTRCTQHSAIYTITAHFERSVSLKMCYADIIDNLLTYISLLVRAVSDSNFQLTAGALFGQMSILKSIWGFGWILLFWNTCTVVVW